MKHAILEDGHQSVFIGILNNSHKMGWMAIHHIHLWNLTMSPKFGTKYIFVYTYIYIPSPLIIPHMSYHIPLIKIHHITKSTEDAYRRMNFILFHIYIYISLCHYISLILYRYVYIHIHRYTYT